MKKLKFIIFPLIVLTAILGGCKKESDPLDHEQYIKQVYCWIKQIEQRRAFDSEITLF
jgi:hypothetical protein